jgi:integrase
MTSSEKQDLPESINRSPRMRANGEGSIYRRKKNGKHVGWTVSYFPLSGKRKYAYFGTKKDAESFLRQAKNDMDYGLLSYHPNPKETVNEFLTRWVEARKPWLKRNGYDYYVESIKRINPYIGHLKAATLSPLAVDQMYASMLAKYKGGTITGAHKTLSSAYNWAVKKKLMKINPMQSVDKPDTPSIPLLPISYENMAKIYREATKDPWLHARVEVAMIMGRRPGEVAGLQWRDLDIFNNQLTVQRQIQRYTGMGLVEETTKTEEILIIPLSSEQVGILMKLRPADCDPHVSMETDGRFIFTNAYGGPLSPEIDRKRWLKLLRNAGVEHHAPYQSRKSAFTFANEHVDSKTLMAYSGHTNMKTLNDSYVFPTINTQSRLLGAQDILRDRLVGAESLTNNLNKSDFSLTRLE